MRKSIKISIIVICFFLISFFLQFTSKSESAKPEKNPFDWYGEYENTLNFIRKHEGLELEPYKDATQTPTIGYGHVIKEDENFPQTITKEQADSMLRKDFAQALKVVAGCTNLRDNKLLAMAHFVYSRGMGNFFNSRMRKYILKGQPIDNEILRWCYIQSGKGKAVKSNYLLDMRKWELKLYKKDELVK